ncbi:GlsB/YeaQ/YmgE family stress response membrane protein [Alphaproteobacteria bacterium GH1-50]|uniref:GlsB/YeaQ/YmgE family stress response membrane protein n=1 Tax=Kangsaoukella pontilimi TaxID=2691042 RepID=A0A7C9MXK0_9RHOB|nr:GlsB/YeaQ/YmgE family stress response membrane protein [Kangsaoukella pontilimi]MXQ09120.1 GlsB/YeaQ/YmgE family stress response membrane protein [Kangsaoukella pontilimi]
MEGFLDALGAVTLIVLAVIGAASGVIAGLIAGQRMPLYILLGIAGAVALPFILAALGVTALAAGGLLLIAFVALIGAVIVLAIGRAIMRK